MFLKNGNFFGCLVKEYDTDILLFGTDPDLDDLGGNIRTRYVMKHLTIVLNIAIFNSYNNYDI